MKEQSAIALFVAYCCAILAGFVVLDVTAILESPAMLLLSGQPDVSWQHLRSNVELNMQIFPAVLLFGFPFALFGASPFTAFFLANIGRLWSASRKSFLIFGSIIPTLTLISIIILFIPPPTNIIKSTGNWPTDYWPLDNKPVKSLMDYILNLLNLGILAMPSGALAGYVFWRMGFSNAPLNQQKMNVKT
ncbi:hypothetical protein GOZ90_09475 [Agrobacterium vitis]|uniref:Uncharacterized protein n=1 Tax=Agrobacterium vitis TaxID=373 RepID=A0A6L6VB71_AGRVI|nr:hypothetical protein [Agrobacterium vitis]MUZ72913.1 hypothetical protein [Agrobacterium vitis]